MQKDKINNKCAITFVDGKMNSYLKNWIKSIRSVYNENIDIYVGTTSENHEKMLSIFQQNNVNFITIENGILDQYQKNDTMNSNKNSRFQFLRLRMFELCQDLNEYTHIIYSDVDTFMLKKIEPKYFKNKNFVFKDFYTKKGQKHASEFWANKLDYDDELKNKILKLVDEGKYFNSGVFILNDFDVFKKLLNIINSNNYETDDQTIMNYFNDGHFEIVDDISMNYIIKEKFFLNPKIIHMSSYSRPIKNGKNRKKWYFELIYSKYKIKERLWENNNNFY